MNNKTFFAYTIDRKDINLTRRLARIDDIICIQDDLLVLRWGRNGEEHLLAGRDITKDEIERIRRLLIPYTIIDKG